MRYKLIKYVTIFKQVIRLDLYVPGVIYNIVLSNGLYSRGIKGYLNRLFSTKPRLKLWFAKKFYGFDIKLG